MNRATFCTLLIVLALAQLSGALRLKSNRNLLKEGYLNIQHSPNENGGDYYMDANIHGT